VDENLETRDHCSCGGLVVKKTGEDARTRVSGSTIISQPGHFPTIYPLSSEFTAQEMYNKELNDTLEMLSMQNELNKEDILELDLCAQPLGRIKKIRLRKKKML
jgi:hypothetical protein